MGSRATSVHVDRTLTRDPALERKALPVTPTTALAIGFLACFALFVWLGRAAPGPRIFPDELTYFEAATSLSEGRRPEVRGEPYSNSPLYPLLLAPIVRASPDLVAAYEAAKVLNALLFALSVVPIYLIGRRVLTPWRSVACALLSLAVPASAYTSAVMTEGLGLFAATSAMYAILLAVEQPSLRRQSAAFGMITLAFLARAQFVSLYAALLIALVLSVAALDRRRRARRTWASVWPSVSLLVVGALGLLLLGGRDTDDLVGAYGVLVQWYDPREILVWLGYHAADLSLYVVFIPIAVAPCVLSTFYDRARAGSEQHAAFLATFVAVNAVVLLTAATFDSGDAGRGRIHDRYTFYLVPLWLMILFAWLGGASSRRSRHAVAGVAVAVGLALAFPTSQWEAEGYWDRFAIDRAATMLWALLDESGLPVGTPLLVVVAAALSAGVLLLPRRVQFVATAFALSVLLVNSAALWGFTLDHSRGLDLAVLGRNPDRTWVDNVLPAGSRVVAIHVACRNSTTLTGQLLLTEFFNSTVASEINFRGPSARFLASTPSRLGNEGLVKVSKTASLTADYVLAPASVEIAGRLIAIGTNGRLGLWRVRGAVRVTSRDTTQGLVRSVCEAASA